MGSNPPARWQNGANTATSSSTSPIRGNRAKGHLLRIVGVGFGIAISVGGTVGAGILRTPGEVAAQLQSRWLIVAVWVLGGIYALCCTLAVTELATTVPKEGGWYVYSRAAFGEYAGFLVGCCDWMMQTVAVAYLAVALGEFTSGLVPGLGPHIKLVGVSGVIILTLLNWLGLRVGSRAQEVTSLIKAFALVAFVVACFVAVPSATGAPAVHLLSTQKSILLALVVALQSVIITYDGWYSAIYFMEEDLDPANNLPRSAIGGIAVSAAIFLLVNVALLHALPMNQLTASQAPAADAAMLVFGSHGRQIILAISVIAVFSTINALLLITPRILFAMGRDGVLPRWMASVNSGGTPSRALFAGAVVAIALVVSGSFETLIAIASVLFVAVYISGFLALLRLRAQRPDMARPFKVWGYPWTVLAVLVASAGFLIASIISDTKHSLFTMVLIAVSYPIYFLGVRKKAGKESGAAMGVLPEVDGD